MSRHIKIAVGTKIHVGDLRAEVVAFELANCPVKLEEVYTLRFPATGETQRMRRRSDGALVSVVS